MPPTKGDAEHDALVARIWANVHPRLQAYRKRQRAKAICIRVAACVLAIGSAIYSFNLQTKTPSVPYAFSNPQQIQPGALKKEKQTTVFIKSKKHKPIYKPVRQAENKTSPVELNKLDSELVKTGISDDPFARDTVESIKALISATVPSPGSPESKNIAEIVVPETMPGLSSAVYKEPAVQRSYTIPVSEDVNAVKEKPGHFFVSLLNGRSAKKKSLRDPSLYLQVSYVMPLFSNKN